MTVDRPLIPLATGCDMNDADLILRAAPAANAVVPMDYAEKAMGSLMQLHSELMEEKERRVDLYRRLMEREQAVAELRMYVKLLEDKLAKKPAEAAPEPPSQVAAPSAAPPSPPARVAPRPPPRPLTLIRSAENPPRPPRPVPPAPEPVPVRRASARRFAASEGWKAW